MRFDKNNAQDDDGHLVSEDSAFSPRLGVQFDIRGDGIHKFNANYGRYVSKIEDGNVGGGANAAGNPSQIIWFYRGPSINPAGTADSALQTTPQALATLWNWFNSVGGTNNSSNLRSVSISGLSTILPAPIVSPHVDEMTLGYGMQFLRSGFARVDLDQARLARLLCLKVAHIESDRGRSIRSEERRRVHRQRQQPDEAHLPGGPVPGTVPADQRVLRRLDLHIFKTARQ